jgi:hypothetical protein
VLWIALSCPKEIAGRGVRVTADVDPISTL